MPLIRTNLTSNVGLYPSAGSQCALELDFFKSNWKQDMITEIREAEILLVADVCYSPTITQGFFECLKYILGVKKELVRVIVKRSFFGLLSVPEQNKNLRHFFFTNIFPSFQCQSFSVYIAIEKRLRVDADGKSVAPNFEHFVELLGHVQTDLQDQWKVESLQTNFKQCFRSYERVQELHLWRISNSSN